MNFNEHQKRKTYGSTRGRGSSSGYARTVEQVQRGTDRPLMNDQREAHMRLGEVIPVTGGMRARGGVMWAKRETFTAIRIAGMHHIQSL